jgi:hypothetical protein
VRVSRSSSSRSPTRRRPPSSRSSISGGARVAVGTTDELGSLIFRKLPPGERLQGHQAPPPRRRRCRPARSTCCRVAGQPAKPQSLLQRVRSWSPGLPVHHHPRRHDAVGVRHVAQADRGGPPFPTVVSYSGYEPSKPGEPLGDGSLAGLCDGLPVICDAPNDPSSLISGLFQYATVNVNIRGTGCSGGAFDFFETMQLLDGYDVIEAVAAQDWVMNGKVGMVGLSYPGITQLFVASTQPPHLAAITPLSVIGAANTTMLPGGILNDGFATAWITNVISKAKHS